MRHCIQAALLAALTLVSFAACQSDCTKLCAKQARCAASESSSSAPAQQQENETCAVMCEAVNNDPERSDEIVRAAACIDQSCDGFRECLRAAAVAIEAKQRLDQGSSSGH